MCHVEELTDKLPHILLQLSERLPVASCLQNLGWRLLFPTDVSALTFLSIKPISFCFKSPLIRSIALPLAKKFR